MQPVNLSRLRSSRRSAATGSTPRERGAKATPRGTPRGPASTTTPTLIASPPYHGTAAVDFFGLSALTPIPGWKRCATVVTVRSATSATEHVPDDAVTEKSVEISKTAQAPGPRPASRHSVDPARPKGRAPRRPSLQACEAAEDDGGREGVPPAALTTSGPLHGTDPSGDALFHARSRSGLFLRTPSGRGRRSASLDASHRLARSDSGLSSARSGRPGRARSPTATSVASHSARLSTRRRGSASVAPRYDASAANHNEDMAALHHRDLHTTLWMATQEGPIEVRDAANPAYLMAVVDTNGTGVPSGTTPRCTTTPVSASSYTSLRLPLAPLAAGTAVGAVSSSRRFVTTLHQIGGNRVVAGLSDGVLVVYDACTLSEQTQLRAHNNAITCMTLVTMPTAPSAEDDALTYPRASVLLTGSSDCTIAKWDGVTLECLGRLSGNRRPVSALAASVGGCFAFSGSEDGIIRLWSLLGNAEVALTVEEQQALRKRLAGTTPRTARGTRVRRLSSSTAHVAGRDVAAENRGEPTRRLFDQKLPPSRRGSRRASRRVKDADNEEALLMPTAATATETRSYGLLAGGGTDIPPVRMSRRTSTQTAGDGEASEADSLAPPKAPHRRAPRRIALQKAGMRADRKPAALVAYLDEVFHTFRGFAPVTAASSALAVEHVASYDDPHHARWPIHGAHKECISDLAVLHDRLLVSACRDGTAMVFALPTGEPIGPLPVERSVPLTAVAVDVLRCCALLGYSDGCIVGFDLLKAAMPRVLDVRPPAICFSSVFVALPAYRMQRLALLRPTPSPHPAAEAGLTEQADAGVTLIAESHRAQVAHGPSQSYSMYRLGEPSLREMKLAMDVADRQRQCLLATRVRAAMRANLTTEQMEAPDMYHCGRVMQTQHTHYLLRMRFAVWQRWCERRRRLTALSGVAATLQRTLHTLPLGQRYLAKWRALCSARRTEHFENHLFIVTHRGRPDDPARMLGLDTGPARLTRTVRENTQSAQRHLAVAAARRVEASLSQHLCRRYFVCWVTAIRDAHVQLRRETAFNRLLLTYQAREDACFDSAAVVRSAVVQRAAAVTRVQHLVPLLCRGNAQRTAQRLLAQYFGAWLSCHRLAKETELATDLASEWSLVTPLSGILVRATEVRRRYFTQWWTAAHCVNRFTRLVEEKHTMQKEWSSLSGVTRIPSSRAQLLKEQADLEEGIRQSIDAKEKALDEEAELQEKLSRLQRTATLQVLTASFPAATITDFEAHTMHPPPPSSSATTPRARRSSATSRSSSVGGGRLASGKPSTTVESGTTAAAAVSDEAAMPSEPSEGEEMHAPVYKQLVAVLKALKGSVLQCARDDKQVMAAHQLTLSLPLEAPRTPAETSASPSGTSAAPQSRMPRLAASTNSLPSVTTPRSLAGSISAGRSGSGGSAAAMWAAHPKEPSYKSVRAAFDGITQRVLSGLETARQDVGPVPARAFSPPDASATLREPHYRDTSAAFGSTPASSAHLSGAAGEDAPRTAPTNLPQTSFAVLAGAPPDSQWLRAVPGNVRKELLGLVLKLVALFDSFTAHSEWPVPAGSAGLSSRAASTLSRLPLTWLCSPATAAALNTCAADLLMLFNPALWQRQRQVLTIDAPTSALPLGGASGSPATHRRTASMTSTSMTSTVSASTMPARPTTPVKQPPTPNARSSSLAASRTANGVGVAKGRTTPHSSSMPPLKLSAEALRSASTKSAVHTPPRSSTTANSRAVKSGVGGEPTPKSTRLTSNPNADAVGGGRSGSFPSAPRRTVEPTTVDVDSNPTPDRDQEEAFNRSYGSIHSGVSTPRSSVLLTPRVSTIVGATTKPYLGFRVAVNKDARTNRSVIAIREVATSYTAPSGEEQPGPALVAGLQTGDVLSRFGGYAVTDLPSFNTIVARHVRSGAEVPVVVVRQGQTIQAKIHVGVRTA